MARRCKCGCRAEINPAAKCDTYLERLGFASIECQEAKAMAALAKIRAKAKRVQQAEDKASSAAVRAIKDNSYPHQFDLTKKVLQKWVNHVRDKGRPCISCGTERPGIIYCGGHYKTAGGNPEIALESKNIHRQCNWHCNSNLSGNISGTKKTKGFTFGLLERYGQDYIDWLDGPHKTKNYSCEQLKEIRAYYSRLIREGNSDDSDRPNQESIQ